MQKGHEGGEDGGVGRAAGGQGVGDPVAVSLSVQERDHRAEVSRLEADIRQVTAAQLVSADKETNIRVIIVAKFL